MRKVIFPLLAFFSFSMSLSAQTAEEQIRALRAKIIALGECVEEFSLPGSHPCTVRLSNGKTVEVLSRNDYKRSAFVTADQVLEDMRLLNESPYLWEMKHRKNGLSLMDNRDLSDWEIRSFDEISQSYFEGTDYTLHLAAHGLLGSDGSAANAIKIGGQELNAKETAELIKLSLNEAQEGCQYILNAKTNQYEKKFVVVVHSCYSASGQNNFAQQLAREVGKILDNVYVVAAPDIVYCTMDSDNRYTECVTTEAALSRARSGGTGIRDKQRWRVYDSEGRDTGLGTQDYKSSVLRAQGLQ